MEGAPGGGKPWEVAGNGPRRAPERPTVAWQLELSWPSQTGNRHVRHGGGRHYLTEEAREYRRQVLRTAEKLGLAGLALAGPFELEMLLEPPNGRARDGDNLEKVVLDAIVRAGVIADDSNRVIYSVRRTFTMAKAPGRILVVARQIKGDHHDHG